MWWFSQRSATLTSQGGVAEWWRSRILVEIDWLRAGRSMEWLGGTPKDYHIVMSRSEWRPRAELCSFLIQETIPTIMLPLKGEGEAIALNLQTVFAEVVERASYDLRIDYSQPLPPPKPSAAVQAWIDELLIQ